MCKQKNYAEKYDEDRFGGAFGRYLEDLEVMAFLSSIDPSYKRVLDVGAGTGKLSIPLSAKHRELVAVDSSEEMLAVARVKAKNKGLELKTVVSDAHTLCFCDKVFDCVVASRLLMHLVDWQKGLSELCRVSRSAVVFDFPPRLSFSSLDPLIKRFKHLFKSNTQVYRTFLISNVERELQKNHFKIVLVKRLFFMPLMIHRWLNMPWMSISVEKLFGMLRLIRILGSPVIVKAVRTD
jgi:ubiquinone/menaquinone biosynthesis C-methylase UbiE